MYESDNQFQFHTVSSTWNDGCLKQFDKLPRGSFYKGHHLSSHQAQIVNGGLWDLYSERATETDRCIAEQWMQHSNV